MPLRARPEKDPMKPEVSLTRRRTSSEALPTSCQVAAMPQAVCLGRLLVLLVVLRLLLVVWLVRPREWPVRLRMLLVVLLTR